MTTDRLDELIRGGNAVMHANFSPKTLALIFDGFLASQFTKKRIVEFVRRYKTENANL